MPIAVSRAEIDAIVNNPAKPTFNNTIVALDRQGRLLSRVEGIFFNLLEADATPEMQQVAENVQPKLTALSNDISLNPQLFERVKAVYEHPGWFLSKEDKKLLEETYNGFVRSGANLSDEDKELYRQYSTELSELSLQPQCAGCHECLYDQYHGSGAGGRASRFRAGRYGRRSQGPWRAGMDGDASGAELRPFHGVFDQPRAEGEALESQQLPLPGR